MLISDLRRPFKIQHSRKKDTHSVGSFVKETLRILEIKPIVQGATMFYVFSVLKEYFQLG